VPVNPLHRLAQRRLTVFGDAGLALLLATASYVMGARPELAPDLAKLATAVPLPAGVVTEWRYRVLLWWLAAVPAIVGLLIQRRRPLPAFGLAAASATAHMFETNLPLLPMDLAAIITLYTLASLTRSRRVGVLAGLVALIGLCAIRVGIYGGAIGLARLPRRGPFPDVDFPWAAGLSNGLSSAAIPALLMGIAWAVGDNTRTRRIHLATLEQRATDLQRERDQRAALAVAAERARITRELHDVVAHGVSVMVVQAQAAAAAQHSHPDITTDALTNVVSTGRASLAEMRRLLGVVRAGAERPLAPQPGLGALPGLIDEVRGAGTPVLLTVEGEPVPLPAGVDLSAYRIVQEALTNTRQHAGAGASAKVRLSFAPERLEIEIADDGSGAATDASPDGNGLRGIAERVTVLGGSLDAGPRAGGGFGVRAMLPITALS
jgi:signal transduction histidine kinase